MSDLIERLKEARRVLADTFGERNVKDDCAAIDEAITALSPVPPDDVAVMIDNLKDYSEGPTDYWGPLCDKAADLLERQARNYESACRLMEMKDDDRDKLQQRIEELEEQIKGQCEVEMDMAAEILELVTKLAALQENK